MNWTEPTNISNAWIGPLAEKKFCNFDFVVDCCKR